MNRKSITSAIICLFFTGFLTGVAYSNATPDEYFVADRKIVEISPTLNEKSIIHATDRFRFLYDSYLAPNDMQAYIAIVPDKGYYIRDLKNRSQMDYEALFDLTWSQMDYATPIDLTAGLSGDSYYATDSHWRQESLVPVAAYIADAMAADAPSSYTHYKMLPATENFMGSYQEAISAFSSVEPDIIYYLTNDILSQAVVYNYDNDSTTGLYDWDKLENRNPYDFFLSGPSALMHIYNPSAENTRKLVVFRDSFGSSLIPLLVPYYQEILVVDIRYTMSNRLDERIDFNDWSGADVLYLYSTLLLNRSLSLK